MLRCNIRIFSFFLNKNVSKYRKSIKNLIQAWMEIFFPANNSKRQKLKV